MKKNQKGFGILPVLLIIVVIFVLGIVSFRVFQKNETSQFDEQNTSKTSVSTAPNPTENEAGWQKFTNEESGIQFSYPENWKSESADTVRYDDGSFGGVGGTLTSPNGNKLEWILQSAGGKGGDCSPGENDLAFSEGNVCHSKEILSVEKAQDVNNSSNALYRSFLKDSLFITRTKYLSSLSNKITYQICLDPFYTSITDNHLDETPIPIVKMGLYFPCEYWSSGFNAKFEVKNEADFNSADAKTAEKIMKTFNIL